MSVVEKNENYPEFEKFLIWLAENDLELKYTGKMNELGEYIMELPEGGTEPFSRKALMASLFPLK